MQKNSDLNCVQTTNLSLAKINVKNSRPNTFGINGDEVQRNEFNQAWIAKQNFMKFKEYEKAVNWVSERRGTQQHFFLT